VNKSCGFPLQQLTDLLRQLISDFDYSGVDSVLEGVRIRSAVALYYDTI
jgi:hypothetical protein